MKNANEIARDVWVFKGRLKDLAREVDLNSAEYSEEIGKNPDLSDKSEYPSITFEVTPPLQQMLELATIDLMEDIKGIYQQVGGLENCSPFRLNKYEKGRGYHAHVDRSNASADKKKREISLIIGINGNYGGGVLQFLRHNVGVRLDQGDVVVFPSSYTHPHKVMPVTVGVRKSLVAWLD